MGEYAATEGSLDATGMRFAIVVARFNRDITEELLDGAERILHKHGAADVRVVWVPGAFEAPLVAKRFAGSGTVDAVICLGAVIRGETAHFEYVAGETAAGISRAALDTGVPVIFGVLTVGPHFGNWLASRLGLSEVIAILWPYVRWTVAVVFAVVSVETLYFISPKKEQRFLETLPGAILAVSGWIVLTYFLGSYFRNRSTQNTVYGSLAGAIAFMVWLCWAGFVVLVGAQLNAEIEKVRHRWGTRSAEPLRPPLPEARQREAPRPEGPTQRKDAAKHRRSAE